MNPDAWKDFINGLFVNADGSRKSAVISLTLEVGDGKLTLPPVEVTHTDTLQQVFIKVNKLLAQSANAEAQPKEDRTDVNIGDRVKAVNVEHIKHGKTEYIVYRMSDDSFQVVKMNGEVVTPKTIVYNTVVKKYREQFQLE